MSLLNFHRCENTPTTSTKDYKVIRCEALIADFIADGPFKTQTIVELVDASEQCGHTYVVSRALRDALGATLKRWLPADLEALYGLVDNDASVKTCLDIDGMDVPLESLSDEQFNIYKGHVSQGAVCHLAYQKELFNTTTQRVRMLEVLRLNALEKRKKPKL